MPFSHTRVCAASCNFHSCFRPKFCPHFSSLPSLLCVYPSHPPGFHQPNSFCWRLQITEVTFMQFSPVSSHSAHFNFLSTELCIWGTVAQPFRRTDKIIHPAVKRQQCLTLDVVVPRERGQTDRQTAFTTESVKKLSINWRGVMTRQH
jgi:hypothetical protein